MKIGRLEAVRQHLYINGASTITELCEAVGASVATLRRDLMVLEKGGLIERVHGGARLAEGTGIELGFIQRENANIAAKRAIADAAFELIQPHSAIFLDAGTTVLQLARRLRLNPMPLTAVTNGLPVAQDLMGVTGVKVLLVGGELRPENASLVGPHAEAQLDRMQFDQLFIGAGAISEDPTIFTKDLAEASLNARMLARSRQRIVLADGSKFGRSATYVVGKFSNLTHAITDDTLPTRWCQEIRNTGVELIVTGGSGGADP
ncbi:DeoR/GlpR family DNA-binding transcription regulator [Devosia algicola]|uniref:DeoR/GlpR family DNA-binding transcription regulator n=1 Tax=Devosia algicola TaxID=3026418 RepID=A0ABY7YQJ3_9HYPH|nr:DeoR/GlpR family DNA-binding transcription regulator [Devosia algicola]WDR03526.1 DeoR/GlpR family DNA-binding transcription regulator [Devosia algicola]